MVTKKSDRRANFVTNLGTAAANQEALTVTIKTNSFACFPYLLVSSCVASAPP